MTLRQLRVVDPGLGVRPAPPRHPASAPEGLSEFATDDVALPRFHVWTLGCQMNRSDSEEMAGALLAAGAARRRRSRRRTWSSSTRAPSARRPSRRSSAAWARWSA